MAKAFRLTKETSNKTKSYGTVRREAANGNCDVVYNFSQFTFTCRCQDVNILPNDCKSISENMLLRSIGDWLCREEQYDVF